MDKANASLSNRYIGSGSGSGNPVSLAISPRLQPHAGLVRYRRSLCRHVPHRRLLPYLLPWSGLDRRHDARHFWIGHWCVRPCHDERFALMCILRLRELECVI